MFIEVAGDCLFIIIMVAGVANGTFELDGLL
jgi:hypothetical protein